MYYSVRVLLPLLALACGLNACTTPGGAVADRRNQVIISVRDQRLTVVKADQTRETFAISTSKFGLGDRPRSYATPLGALEVAGKIGAGAPAGTVFHGRVRTGEIVPENAPGRDPIVTRILRLRGLEDQNSRAASRGIYIHGTPEESKIGEPVSYGCIRMKSSDVIRLFDLVGVGSRVMILDSPLNQAVAAVAPVVPKPVAAPATAPVAAPTTAAPAAPAAEEPAKVAAQPAPAAAIPAKAESRMLSSSAKRGSDGVWAGDPGKMLGEAASPKKSVTKPKAKSMQLAQRAKSTQAKSARSDDGDSL
ncbi:hypothetical protein AYO41_03965 [Verrucomicrobia bacterium SCGC AG-212-E04]|nr:hypothetical protein AYO41_03965 [Verrucomicrobia bacterium SCGC AG-212-E04]